VRSRCLWLAVSGVISRSGVPCGASTERDGASARFAVYAPDAAVQRYLALQVRCYVLLSSASSAAVCVSVHCVHDATACVSPSGESVAALTADITQGSTRRFKLMRSFRSSTVLCLLFSSSDPPVSLCVVLRLRMLHGRVQELQRGPGWERGHQPGGTRQLQGTRRQVRRAPCPALASPHRSLVVIVARAGVAG
jgi:hypothetical protein